MKHPKKQMPSVMEAKTKLHNDKQYSKDNLKEIGLCPFEHVTGRPMSKENLTSDSLAQTECQPGRTQCQESIFSIRIQEG